MIFITANLSLGSKYDFYLHYLIINVRFCIYEIRSFVNYHA